ncbi:MAG: hypothetical protein HOM88_02610 [Hellea sp.]|jgi:hypothetical protein|nr:CotH kinase family protein [Hellea sp.]MBT4995342.1 hypothetical protein [Hellea sp.]MDA8888975.1 CotH kinase family protein [Hellea sp.]MDB4844741.1 CotH kinase family protein [Hellea sp.]MDC0422010.1 CotH kinase family protein [Hellea sp.]MDC1062630.1 CotH kinase family protein [Hellea sp.]
MSPYKVLQRIKTYLLTLSVLVLTACGGDSPSNPPPSVAANSPPIISGEVSSIRVGEGLNFTPTASDPNNDNLTFSSEGLPEWVSFNTATGQLTGTPLDENLGSVSSITITVSDGQLTSSIAFDLEVMKPVYFISVKINGMDEYRDMDVELSGCFDSQESSTCNESEELETFYENGTFSNWQGLLKGENFEIKIDRDPARQECEASIENGIIDYADQIIDINCQADPSAALFDKSKLHKIRIIMTADEWNRFVLDTERARYSNGDANGSVTPWNTWTHSEVYRQVDFEYLDEAGNTLESHTKVGFKMKGNTARQWPEHWYQDFENGQENMGYWTFKPRRFSFSLKFDEEFDEDEGVYSCIDASGEPAAVSEHPCNNRIGKDLDEVPENDGREFMDLEKIYFRYNRDDPSYQRELTVHEILNSLGIPTPRMSHASIELLITGENQLYGKDLPMTFNMGVFQMVEQVDKPFMKRYFGKNGFLFKIGAEADLSGTEEAKLNCVPYEGSTIFFDPNYCLVGVEKSDPDSREEWLGSNNYMNPTFVNSDINDQGGEISQFKPYKPKYDLKTKKKSIAEGRGILQDFMRFVQSNPSAAELAEQFDVRGFIKAHAAEIVLGAVDHYVKVGNNYYLYYNPLKDKWVYLVHDNDFVLRDHHPTTWGSPDWARPWRDIATTYAFPSPGKIHWTERTINDSVINPILWDIIFSEPTNKQILYGDIKFILDNKLDWDILSPILETRNQLLEDAINNTDAENPDGCELIYNASAIDAENSTGLCDEKDISIKKYIELRRETLYQELAENGY